MNERKYNLLYELNRFINDADDSVDEVLAIYFLTNFSNAKFFNIYDIAAECNVSRSSIRRFAKKLGYDNFLSLKKYMISVSEIHDQTFPDANYRKVLTISIHDVINELDERMDTDQVEYICKKIMQSKNVYLTCNGNSLSAVKNFQVNCSAIGQPSKLIYGKNKFSMLTGKSTSRDLLIVISLSGIYSNEISTILKQFKGHKILVTVNRLAPFGKFYDNIYYLSHTNHSEDTNIYREYGLNYFFGILSNHLKR